MTDRRRLLVTDLDGTFVGDDDATDRLWDMVDAHGIDLVFATGRRLAGVDELYVRLATDRRAVAAICMVGTEIWVHDGRVYLPDSEWSRHIDVGWDPRAIAALAARMPGIKQQESRWQSAHKSSWYFTEDPGEAAAALARAVDESGLEARVVVSAGRFVDLIPRRAGKGEALRYLMDRWGIEPSDVVTAGDSGNDIDMMDPELGVRSIAVGNAHPELLEAAGGSTYVASAGFAAGLIEGLEHFGWVSATA